MIYNKLLTSIPGTANSFASFICLTLYCCAWPAIFCLLRLRWEGYVRKAGEEEDWKRETRDRGGWKRLSDEAVKKLQAAPHP